jgi:sporulation protein YlmC with PRC-barrel domain
MPSAGDSAFGADEPVRVSNFMTQAQPGQWQVSNLEGLEVYNSNNENIGDISELILDRSGKVQAVVVGVGGFLGVGAREVAFPFDQIRFVHEPRADSTGSTTGEARLAGTSPGGGTAPSPSAAGTAAAPPTNSNMATNNADANRVAASGSVGARNQDQQTASTGSRAVPNHAVLIVPITKEQLQQMPEFQQP